MDVVTRYPEAMWISLDDAKARWIAATGGDAADLERADGDARGRRVKAEDKQTSVASTGRTGKKSKGRAQVKAVKKGKSKGKGKEAEVQTPGRRQSGRLQSMKKRPAAATEEQEEVTSLSPLKRTRNISPHNATPGPSGAHEGS